MKLNTTPLHALETEIRRHLKAKRNDDEAAAMLAIRLPLGQIVGPEVSQTLLRHPIGHAIYLRVRLELSGFRVAGLSREELA